MGGTAIALIAILSVVLVSLAVCLILYLHHQNTRAQRTYEKLMRDEAETRQAIINEAKRRR